MENEEPRIARWFCNYDAAISLRFDDSLNSHVHSVIPLLNQYGFKATFMVNPGRPRYRRNKIFWEEELPKMGHRLGNHTMNHRGATDINEAEYEIGKVSRLIRKLYPDESPLQVFASGGGEKWGGEYWEKGGPKKYKEIVDKYNLIDLYDGSNPSVRGDGNTSSEKLCEGVTNAIQRKKHQAFHFHNVGKPTLRDWISRLLGRTQLSIAKSEFIDFLECLERVKDKIWLTPLVQALKYETEYYSAKIETIKISKTARDMRLTVKTDANLYDQQLTLILPVRKDLRIKSITQNDQKLERIVDHLGRILVNIRPQNSNLYIRYKEDKP